MNIFWLDNDLRQCAIAHCDKHVVKMCVEYAQILSTVSRQAGLEQGYRETHKNHPCVKWCSESIFNRVMLFQLELCLGAEFTYRFGKQHKSVELVKTLKLPNLPLILPTKPPLCMPDKYKTDDVILSYREYYIGEKQEITYWSYRPMPEWYRRDNP